MKERYRPHHIVCERLMDLQFPDRGGEFQEAKKKLRNLIESNGDILVEAVEGPDQICGSCPNCRDERCCSPKGDEVEVRKWDRRVLQSLGIDFGQAGTPAAWRKLIEEKLPSDFCKNRCGYRSICSVFSSSPAS